MCILISIQHIHNVVQSPSLSIAIAPKVSFLKKETFYPLSVHSLRPSPPASGKYQYDFCTLDLLFWIFKINDIIQYLIFYVWLLSLSVFEVRSHRSMYQQVFLFHGCIVIPQFTYPPMMAIQAISTFWLCHEQYYNKHFYQEFL